MRDPYLRSFGSFDELVGLAEASEEPELRQLVRVVCGYGHQIPRLIEDIRSRHTDVPKHAWADFDGIYFCTAHKAKGREWPKVRIAADFPTSREEEVADGDAAATRKPPSPEEIRLAYVAVTRAKLRLDVTEPGSSPPRPESTTLRPASRAILQTR